MTSNFTLLSNDILVYLGSRVPVHIQIEFPEPKYGLKLFGPLYSPSKLCYFGKVILFLNNFFLYTLILKDVAAILKLFGSRSSTCPDAGHRTRSQDNISNHRATQDSRAEQGGSPDSRVEDRGSQDSMVENIESDGRREEQEGSLDISVEFEGSQDSRVELRGYQDNVLGHSGSDENIGSGLSGSRCGD